MNSAASAFERTLPPELSTAVLDAIPDALLVFNPERRMMFANAAAMTIFRGAGSTSIEELRNWFPLFDPATERPVDREQGPLAAALRGETSERREFMVRRAHGGVVAWIECGARPVFDAEGKVSAAIMTFRIIDDRKREENARAASNQLRDFIFRENLAGIVVSTVDGRIVDCNDALLRMLGYESKQELLSMRAHQLYMDPAERDRIVSDVAANRRVSHYDVAYRRRDGSCCWAVINVRMLQPAPGEIGGSMISTVLDITERRAGEEELRRSEHRFAAFMRFLPGVAFIKDLKGRYVYYNDSSKALFGLEPEEITGKTDDDLWHPEIAAQYRENDAKVIESRRHFEFLETVQHSDGPHSWLVYKFPIVEEDKVEFVGGVGIDVTERQIMEQQLMQARKMDALGLLAGGVAHDFNNLLTVISGFGHLAVDSLGERPEPKLADYLTRMLDGARRASGITSQLLAFSRREVVKPLILDLAEVVSGMEKLLRTMIGEHVVLRIHPGTGQCLVCADEHQLQQVVINLAVNARDAMPLGGELDIRCEKLAEPLEREGQPPLGVLLEVRDNGIGMDEGTLGRMYDPFFTSKAKGKGTGLGLSTVYGIVSQAKGRIDAESVLSEGTTFRIFFPLASGDVTSPAETPKRTAAPGRERVLLVEDDASVRSLAKAVLTRSGYRVVEADSGAAALALWEAHEGAFDVLVSDVVMPRMSGGELAVQLRERNPRLKVLFMSGYAGDMLSRSGVMENEIHLLPKPFTPDVLTRTLREVLDA